MRRVKYITAFLLYVIFAGIVPAIVTMAVFGISVPQWLACISYLALLPAIFQQPKITHESLSYIFKIGDHEP